MTPDAHAGQPSGTPVPAWALDVVDRIRGSGAAGPPSSGQRPPIETAHLHDGILSEVQSLRCGEDHWIVKRHRFDLAAEVERDPDPRYEAMSRWLTLAPFFGSTAERIAYVRPHVPLALPEVVAEGRLADGGWFTAMRRLEGRSAAVAGTRAHGRQRKHASAVLGRFVRDVRQLGPPSGARSWNTTGEWFGEWRDTWHCLVDGLPAATTLPGGGQATLHARIHRLLERARECEFGPPTLVHGDLTPANLLYSWRSRPVALLDFQLSCTSLAAQDFRWIGDLDAHVFLDACGWPRSLHAQACWVGALMASFWQAMILVLMHRWVRPAVPDRLVAESARVFFRGLDALGDGPPPNERTSTRIPGQAGR